jgi:hypothetical protein
MQIVSILGSPKGKRGNTWQLLEPGARGERLAVAADLGERLVEAIRTRARYPEQEPERQAFHARLRQLVLQSKDQWPYEYEYWLRAGRL